jgi:2',3'-cyclic-nucleotide 2'-phosphodiesterase (5'-nucleotidase family)
VNGIPIVEAGASGSRYAVVDLRRIGPDSVDAWIRGIPVAWADEVDTDNAAAALVQRYLTQIGPALNRPVTWLARDLSRSGREHTLGRLVADANRRATRAQVALINNTGIRADLRAGAVTWGLLYEVEPFGNRLYRLTITGAQLRETLEHALAGSRPAVHISGMSVFYDPSAEPGQRVRTIRLDDGAVVRDGDVLTIGLPDFLAEGGDGYEVFRNALERKDSGADDLGALVDYFEGLPAPVEPPTDERLRPVTGAGAPGANR